MGAKSKSELPNFSKAIRDVSNRYHLQQIFDDFLQMSVCCFTLGKLEDLYLKVSKRYDQGELNRFSLALAAMIKEYTDKSQEGGWWDVLGSFFEEINSPSSAQRSGQFFTPVHVCDLMAKLLVKEAPEEQITVVDPTCGSGRNLIAESRLDPHNRYSRFYVAQDLDSRCVNMTVLNYIMYGMKGVVIHMNTLSMEVYSGYRVYLPETGLGVLPLNEQQCKQFLIKPAFTSDKTDEAPPGPSSDQSFHVNFKVGKVGVQKSLFD